MTEEEIKTVHKWLAENPDKWENWCGFRLLVPEEQVPPLILKYIAFEKENNEFLEQQEAILDSLNVD